MTRILRHAPLVAGLLILLTLQGCDRYDDLQDIFTEKTWKLTYNPDLFDGLFDTQEEKEATLKKHKSQSAFTIVFKGNQEKGLISGTFTAQATSARLSGTWRADGRSNELQMVITTPAASETDVLGKEMIRCIQNAYSYRGDIHNILIYYRTGVSSYMGFTPQK